MHGRIQRPGVDMSADRIPLVEIWEHSARPDDIILKPYSQPVLNDLIQSYEAFEVRWRKKLLNCDFSKWNPALHKKLLLDADSQ